MKRIWSGLGLAGLALALALAMSGSRDRVLAGAGQRPVVIPVAPELEQAGLEAAVPAEEPASRPYPLVGR